MKRLSEEHYQIYYYSSHRKYANKSKKFYVRWNMISGNQILIKSASSISFLFLLLLLLLLLLFSFHQQKKSYSLSVNPFLGASVTKKNRFSKLSAITDFKIGFLQASFLNLLTHAVLRGKMDTRWSSLKQLGKIIAQALSLKHVEYNLFASKGVSEVRTVSLVSFFVVVAIR